MDQTNVLERGEFFTCCISRGISSVKNSNHEIQSKLKHYGILWCTSARIYSSLEYILVKSFQSQMKQIKLCIILVVDFSLVIVLFLMSCSNLGFVVISILMFYRWFFSFEICRNLKRLLSHWKPIVENCPLYPKFGMVRNPGCFYRCRINYRTVA